MWSGLAALMVGCALSGAAHAGGSGTEEIPIFQAVLDESARAELVQHHLGSHGRDFVVYLLKMDDLDDGVLCAVGCDAASTYTIDRESAGTGKWIGLKLGNLLAFSGMAEDLRFEPLADRINRQGGTSATEFLQMAVAEVIDGLIHIGGDLKDVSHRLSMTYAFSAKDRSLVMAPTALHLVEGALSDDGAPVRRFHTANIFTKHAFLARLLNEEQRINMAGEIYMKIEPKDGVPREEIFGDDGIDLDKIYDRERRVVDLDRVAIELVVKNDSGTYKPRGAGIVPFAWTLMKALKVDRVGFEAYGSEVAPGFVEDQGHSTWKEFLAANPTLVQEAASVGVAED